MGRVVESVSSLSLSLSFFPLCPHKKKEKCDNNILILDTALFVGGLPSGDLFSVLIDPAERSKTKKQIHCSSNYYYYPRKKVCLGLTINDRLLLLSIRRGREAKRERKKRIFWGWTTTAGDKWPVCSIVGSKIRIKAIPLSLSFISPFLFYSIHIYSSTTQKSKQKNQNRSILNVWREEEWSNFLFLNRKIEGDKTQNRKYLKRLYSKVSPKT